VPVTTLAGVQAIIANITFRDYEWVVLEKGDGFLLQATFYAPDSETGAPALQKCRKWYVSSHATTNEVIRTAWKAILAAIEHEAAEDFLYKGVTVFNPHVDFDAVVEAKLGTDVRT